MRFTNLTRELEIGANSYLLETGAGNVVMDAGLHPKHDGNAAMPDWDPLEGVKLSSVLLTHAHQDHVGSLPVLRRMFPESPVFATQPTIDLADAMLHNSVNVMKKKRVADHIPEYPLFSHRDTAELVKAMRHCPLRTRWTLDGERLALGEQAGASFEFHHSGHILGSVGIVVTADGRRLLYTGDVNFNDQTMSQGASLPDEDIDILVMETTRGDSPTPGGFTRRAEEERFAEAIELSFERGGCTLVPVFALGKTQELLCMVHRLRKEGLIRDKPLYIGGLSTKVTNVHDKHASSWPRRLQGQSLFDATDAITLNGRDINHTPINKPRIYALSSGMMTEKTLSNAFARRILSDNRCSLFFIGYTDPDSPAGRIRAAGMGGEVRLEEGLPMQEIRCHIEEFNFSAHASRESLVDYAVRVAPKKILLVHGDPGAVAWFRDTLSVKLPGTEIILPLPGRKYEV